MLSLLLKRVFNDGLTPFVIQEQRRRIEPGNKFKMFRRSPGSRWTALREFSTFNVRTCNAATCWAEASIIYCDAVINAKLGRGT